MQLPIYQVDAFADRVFSGNPAAVCPLPSWIADEQLQAIAAENNLAETAFFVQKNSTIELRWFTPRYEIDLCGHATLAAAHVLFEHLNFQKEEIVFDSKSGRLTVKKAGDLLSMDFPSRPPQPIEASEQLQEALGVAFSFVGKSRDMLVEVENEEVVRNLRPRMALIEQLDCVGVIVTARADEEGVDFVSRFFAPQAGVPEDPVTGSAHSTLIPYWGEKLGKTRLIARQISSRGGSLWTEWQGERVTISGKAITYLTGEISF